MLDSPAPYEPKIQTHGGEYFPSPYSDADLSDTLRYGLVPLGILGLVSVLSTVAVIGFIGFRFISWRAHYKSWIGYNQYVVLVLNLLLADLQQSSAFVISFHWIRINAILAPSQACFAQGWLLHSGDVASGFFVLAIALHTFYTAVYGQRIRSLHFALSIVGIWAFAYVLTGLGLGIHGHTYFVRAGAWCWVSSAYEADRLACHYIWLFIVQFGTILIYVMTFVSLRKKTSHLFAAHSVGATVPNSATIEAVNRVTMLMTLYPCVYVVLTLPLSRRACGPCPTTAPPCGWVDSLLYTLTRKRLLRDTMSGHSHSSRGPGTMGNWDDSDLSKGITHTRTVTVEGGHMLEMERPGGAKRRPRHSLELRDPERPPSPSDSVDPILMGSGFTKTEITVGVHEVRKDEADDSDGSLASEKNPTYMARFRRS
ncbi:Pfam:Git3 C [Teratosphaeria destructans]|uniref:Pfam:Git3 C n=1 Tax=Teratosphaeria destructans TaxID=418781 RepID=A0A9W7ST35_9PEZI|nr:Pfam:Git3 C [Teratosphaeria destructans]